MPYCNPCGRQFATQNGLQNHLDNAAMHQETELESESKSESESESESEPEWECDYCDLCFWNEEDLDQHTYEQHSQPDYECSHCKKSFGSEHALHQHCSDAYGHPYCASCKRMFSNDHNLKQHLRSSVHRGDSVKCPWCKNGFPTASAVTIHVESGTCRQSGLDRQKLNEIIQKMDRKNIITKPMLTLPGYVSVQTYATELSWNGHAYQCYLCRKEFASLNGLNNHVRSPAHEQNIYHCPKLACRKEFKVLSGLIQHVESESCGVMRFTQVQQGAKDGIGNMIGRMIGN